MIATTRAKPARIADDDVACIVPQLPMATGLSALAHVPLPKYSQPPPDEPNALNALHQPQPVVLAMSHAVQLRMAPHVAEPVHMADDTGVTPSGHF